MVLEYREISQALSRNEEDPELLMMRMVVQARASAMEADMEDEENWLQTYSEGCIGQSVYCRPVSRLTCR
jgi:hypothetical protein